MAYDYDRPFIPEQAMGTYLALDKKTASLYGKKVRATMLPNAEYRTRFFKMSEERNMKGPPDGGKIYPGYLVVRKWGTPKQYETWLTDEVFEELYKPTHSPST